MKTHVYLGLINSGKGQAMYYARTKKKTIAVEEKTYCQNYTRFNFQNKRKII